jgi:hypothetical protein
MVLWKRGWSALAEAIAAQVDHVGAEDPVQRFPDLLRSALTSGHCHFVCPIGDRPKDPRAWGWRQREVAAAKIPPTVWEPQGKQVGWIDGEDIYLDPHAAYRVANQIVSTDGLAMSERTLWKRMSERGMLVSTDESRKRNLVRKMLQGSRRNVLHLHLETLIPQETAQTAQTAQSNGSMRADGPFSWALSAALDEKRPTETAHKVP